MRNHFVGQGLGIFFASIQAEFRLFRSFIRIVDAREAFQFAGPGFLVEALRIALFANFDRRVDKDFDKIARLEPRADRIAVPPIRTNERRQSDNARRAKQLGDSADAADILFAVLCRKAQAKALGKLFSVSLLEQRRRSVQAVTHIVAVEHEAAAPHRVQFVIDQVADRAFAARAQTGEPDNATFVFVQGFALFAAHAVLVPMNVNFFVGHGCGNSSGRYNLTVVESPIISDGARSAKGVFVDCNFQPKVAAVFDFAAKFGDGLSYQDFLARHGSEEHRRRWAQVHERVQLTLEQREVLAGFVREMKVLCLAGAWCGDCVNQCPIFQRFVEGSSRIVMRYFDRDAHGDLQAELRLCGGNRVPVVVFLSEDDEFLGLAGDRTLAKYRQMAIDQLGPSCPTGITPPHQSLLDAVTQEWLNEFERIQLMLRLSSRLRQLHGD